MGVFRLAELEFGTEKEAEAVLNGLRDFILGQKRASVADYYTLAGVRTNVVYDVKYGWTDLSSAKVRSTEGIFVIDLPEPQEIGH